MDLKKETGLKNEAKPNIKAGDIANSVQKAIQTGDFSNINNMVKDTVHSAVNEVVEGVIKSQSYPLPKMRSSDRQNGINPSPYHTRQNSVPYPHMQHPSMQSPPMQQRPYGANPPYAAQQGSPYATQPTQGQYPQNRMGYPNPNQNRNFLNPQNTAPMGKATSGRSFLKLRSDKYVIGHIQRIIGGVMGFCFGFPLIVCLISIFTEMDINFVIASIVLAPFFGVSAWGFWAGQKKLKNYRLAKRYYAYLKDRQFVNISEIAGAMRKNTAIVQQELQEIMDEGIFSDMRFDKERKSVILNNTVYQEYIAVEEQKRQLQLEDQISKSHLDQSAEAANLTQEQKELWISVVSEGENYIKKLRKLNDDIPGEIISKKLDQLEHLLHEIFERVKMKPLESPQLRKFMEYYLPTTLKLVEKYKEFDLVSQPSKEIQSAKIEIEKTLDTINQAFVEMLNNLFRNDVYDASTDAQVLKTMLAKEGLTKDGISK